MTTPDRVVAEAAKWVGYREGPRSNETVFGARSGFQFQPWCGSFTDAVLADAGLKGEPSSVYTPAGLAAYRRLGRSPKDPRRGDLVFFNFPGGEGVDHVGIVEHVNRDGSLETIEGNTSPGNAGSQANGGGVYRRHRERNVVAGFGRPDYPADAPTEEERDLDADERRWLAEAHANSLSTNKAVGDLVVAILDPTSGLRTLVAQALARQPAGTDPAAVARAVAAALPDDLARLVADELAERLKG